MSAVPEVRATPKRGRRLFVTDRDFEVLKFLWKWKAASTAALTKSFFPGVRPFTAYERLLQLEKKRYIQHTSFRYRGGGAWVLAPQGYKFLAPFLLEMKAKGYRSENILHDYFATAFHLGEWLTHQPAKGVLCSEQELRRLEPDLLPPWVPRSEKHRPDGYTAYDSEKGAHLYAFECELSVKSRARYEQTLSFYDEEDTIAAVFWLAGSQTIQSVIQRCVREQNVLRPHLHHFLQLGDFKRAGWMAHFAGGILHGTSLSSLLLDKAGTEVGRSSDGSNVSALLQNQKRPILPNDKKPPVRPDRSD
jgi:hypothetical protein